MAEQEGANSGLPSGKITPPSDFSERATTLLNEALPSASRQPLEPTVVSLSVSTRELADRIRTRSFAESAYSLRQAYKHLHECRSEPCVDSKSTQVGDLALLPTKGTVFMFSDLEGNIEDLVSALDEFNFLERLRRDDPEDQVFLCVLGDSIDRSRRSSELVELLLELKTTPEFSRNIIILPGNHELSMNVQCLSDGPRDPRKRLGLRDEVVLGRDSHKSVDLAHEDVKALASLCYEPRFADYRPFQERPASDTDRVLEARVGMWLLFNDIFQVLPKMILSGNGLYAAHAGFPARRPFSYALEAASSLTNEAKHETLMTMSAITDVSPERQKCHPSNRSLDDITWSDIAPHLDDRQSAQTIGNNLRGFGGTVGPGVAWGGQALRKFGEISGATLFIRGHQPNAPSHPDVRRLSSGAWRYKNALTINSSKDGLCFVSLDLSIKDPTPEHVRVHTPLIDL